MEGSLRITQTCPHETVHGSRHVAGLMTKCYWDGDKLILEPAGDDIDPRRFVLTRYMEGDKMVTLLTYPSKPGVTMIRKFTKQ